MSAATLAFPVWRGLQGMNALTMFLNAKALSGNWHFDAGTRYDQASVNIVFDDPSDAVPAMVQAYSVLAQPAS